MSVFNKALVIVLLLQVLHSIVSSSAVDPKLHLVKLTDPDAMCLDGTLGAYYISTGGDPKKIYLEF